MRRNLLFVPMLLAAGLALGEEVPEAERVCSAAGAQDQSEEAEHVCGDSQTRAQSKSDTKLLPGMSILGNQEAPKSLVIVPWKSSELGASLGISTVLDDSRQPVDKDVFMRALSYYYVRSDSTPQAGAPPGGRDGAAAKSDATQPAAAAHRRK